MAATDSEIYDLAEQVVEEVIDTWLDESGAVWDKFIQAMQDTADQFLSVGSIINPSKAVLDAIFGVLDNLDILVSDLSSVPLRVAIVVVAALMPTPDGLGTTVMTTESAAETVMRMTAQAMSDLIANPLPIQLRIIDRIKGYVGLRKAWRSPSATSILGVVKGKMLSALVRMLAFALRFGATVFSLFVIAQLAVEINRSSASLLKGNLRQDNPREQVECKGSIRRRVGR